MIRAIISDFSRTLLLPKDTTYHGSLNELYKQVNDNPDFKFFNYFIWNQALHEHYKKLKIEKKLSLYIFTTDKIQEDPDASAYTRGVYSDIFTVRDVNGLTKDNPDAYRMLSLKIELEPSEILFVDDSETNINAAKEVGINTIKYHNMTQFMIDILELQDRGLI